MQKKIRKFVRFIVVVLFITICALIVNKTSELKIFGAREAYADSYVLGSGTYIQVDGGEYEFEVQPDDYAYVYVTISGLSSDEMKYAYIQAEVCPEDGLDGNVIEVTQVNNRGDKYIEVKGVGSGKSQVLRITLFDGDDNKLGTDAYVRINVMERIISENIEREDSNVSISAVDAEITVEDENTVSVTTPVGKQLEIFLEPSSFSSRRMVGARFVGNNADDFSECTEGFILEPDSPGSDNYNVFINSIAPGQGSFMIFFYNSRQYGPDTTEYMGEPLLVNWTIVDNSVSVPVEGISTPASKYTGYLGNDVTIAVEFSPSDATQIPTSLTWNIDDDEIIEYKSEAYDTKNKLYKGVFEAKKIGTTTVDITIPDTDITTSVDVEVKPVPIQSLSMTPAYQANKSEEFTLSATAQGENIDETTLENELEWIIDDTSILALGDDSNRQGKVYSQSFVPLKAGSTTVSVQYPGTNIFTSCTVTVVEVVNMTGIELNEDTLQAGINDTIFLSATAQPSGATDAPTNLIWEIGDQNVVKLDESTSGTSYYETFNAVGVGTTTITVKTPDGRFYDTATVSVYPSSITELFSSQETINFIEGDGAQLVEITWNPSHIVPIPAISTRFVGTQGIASCMVESSTSEKITLLVNPISVGTTTLVAEVQGKQVSIPVNIAPPMVFIDSISLNKTSESLKVSQGMQLTISTSPENANVFPSEFEWEISNPALMERIPLGTTEQGSVELSAEFRALAAGTTTITAKYPGRDITASCVVTITDADVEMTGIAFDKGDSQVEINNSITINASIEPNNVTNPPQTLVWSVGDNTILEEDTTYSNGEFSKKFNAKKIGTTTITASTTDGAFSKTINVEVIGNIIQELYIDHETLPLTIGTDGTLKLTWVPNHMEPTPVPTLSYSQSGIVDASVQVGNEEATITLTPLSVGTTTLTATVQNKQVTCEITVVNPTIPIESISLDKTTESLKVGQGLRLTASVTPSNSTEIPNRFSWVTSNDNLEQVMLGLDTDEPEYTAVFNAVKAGTTTITVSVPGTNISASCVVTIAPEDVNMTGIELDVDDSIELEALSTVTINASIIPDNTTNPPTTLVWEVGDSTKLINYGQNNSPFTKSYKAVGIGETTITVKTPDEAFSKTVTVNIVPTKITQMNIDKTELSMKMGENGNVKVTWTPTELIPQANPTISFTEDGIVETKNLQLNSGKYDITLEALKVGTTTMTVSCQDKQVSCDITVEPISLEAISLDRKTATVKIGNTIALNLSLKPDNTTELPDEVLWKLSNTKMEQVLTGLDDEKPDYREFRALEVGETTITVSIPGTDLSDTCVVTIVDDDIDMTGVQLDKETAEVTVFESIDFNASIIPENATDAPSRLVWTIEDDGILEEDSSTTSNSFSKKFNAIGVGETTITVKTPDGSFSDTATITVNGNEVEELFIDKTYWTLDVERDAGEVLELTWNPEKVLPIPDIDISISDETVLEISEVEVDSSYALLTLNPLKVGRTMVTAKVGDKEVSCEIVVVPTPVEIESISLDKKTETVKVGQGVQLTVNVEPDDATELPDKFLWRVSNSKMQQILVGQNPDELEYTAEFNALEVGTTMITVSTPDGKYSDTCVVTIQPADEPEDQLVVDIDEYSEAENGVIDYLESNNELTLSQLTSNIETNGTINVYIKGQKVTDVNAKLPTGAVIEISKGNQKVSFELVVRGDLNGDADVDEIDLLMLARFNAGFNEEVNAVKGPYLRATNVKNDDAFGDDIDLLKLARLLVGLE